MEKRKTYALILRQKPDWDPYLLAESGLPGPRGNLELAQAAADEGRLEQFNAWLAWDAQRAPVNSPYEFLAFCGAVGLGRLLAEGHRQHLARLRSLAADPRWRMREGVAMALQRLGECNMPALLEVAFDWIEGRPYEMRAAAAGLCEPALLKDAGQALSVVQALERITTRLAGWPERKNEEFLTLRQAMGYCWSVAAAACLQEGKARMQSWAASPDRDLRWIIKENLKKKRLIRLDPGWVEQMQEMLG